MITGSIAIFLLLHFLLWLLLSSGCPTNIYKVRIAAETGAPKNDNFVNYMDELPKIVTVIVIFRVGALADAIPIVFFVPSVGFFEVAIAYRAATTRQQKSRWFQKLIQATDGQLQCGIARGFHPRSLV